MTRILYSVITLISALAVHTAAESQPVGKDYYTGKSIRAIVGDVAGGDHDTYTRAIAKHIGKHIPGNPTTYVENMPGAGGQILAHYIYSVAEPNGLTIGVWNGKLMYDQALGVGRVRLDGRRFSWIGAPVREVPVCAIMDFTGLKTLSDVLNSQKPIKMFATSPGNISHDLPTILNMTLGSKFDLATGYNDAADLRSALQSNETDGVCFGWGSLKRVARDLLDGKGGGKLVPFIVHEALNDPEVKNQPVISDTLRVRAGDQALSLYRIWVLGQSLQHVFTLPPETPRELTIFLRYGFQKTFTDPEFLAEVKRSQLGILPVSGETIQRYVDQILSMPDNLKEQIRAVIKK